MIARISKILLLKGSKSAQGILVVAKYDVGEALHPHYRMPVLIPDAEANRVIVASDVSPWLRQLHCMLINVTVHPVLV